MHKSSNHHVPLIRFHSRKGDSVPTEIKTSTVSAKAKIHLDPLSEVIHMKFPPWKSFSMRGILSMYGNFDSMREKILCVGKIPCMEMKFHGGNFGWITYEWVINAWVSFMQVQ